MWKSKQLMTNSQEKTVCWGRKPLYNSVTTFLGDANSKPVVSHRESTLQASKKKKLFLFQSSFACEFVCLFLFPSLFLHVLWVRGKALQENRPSSWHNVQEFCETTSSGLIVRRRGLGSAILHGSPVYGS